MSKHDGQPTDNLNDLAERINQEHAAVEASLRDSLAHARNAGQLLLEAKGKLPHGQWQAWRAANCQVADRTARAYMRIASRWEELKTATRCRFEDLSFRSALQALTDARDEQPTDTPAAEPQQPQSLDRLTLSGLPADRRHQLAREWWDILAGRTLLLDALGWSVERIAEHFGVTIEEIEAILTPRPPRRFDSRENGAGLLVPDGEQAYRDAVQVYIARQQWLAYEDAAWLARKAGREDLHDDLKGQCEYHLRRSQRLEPNDILEHFGDDAAITADLCAVDDARAALRIEPPRPFDQLWADNSDVAQSVPA